MNAYRSSSLGEADGIMRGMRMGIAIEIDIRIARAATRSMGPCGQSIRPGRELEILVAACVECA
ncbi:MAG: hypothetical protein ABI613_11000 [Gemmatimonadota bacterium]